MHSLKLTVEMLCNTCLGMIRDAENTGLGQRLERPREDLLASAAQGCYMCTRVRISASEERWARYSKPMVKYVVHKSSKTRCVSFLVTAGGPGMRMHLDETTVRYPDYVSLMFELT